MKIKYIVSIHASFDKYRLLSSKWKKSIYLKLVLKKNLKKAYKIHATSYNEANSIKKWGLFNLYIAPNGTEIVQNSRYKPKGSALNICYLGRNSDEKNIQFALTSVSILRERYPSLEINFHIITDKADNRFNKKYITVYLNKFGKELSDIIEQMDIGIIPSLSDQCPTSALILLAHGIPTICSLNSNIDRYALEFPALNQPLDENKFQMSFDLLLDAKKRIDLSLKIRKMVRNYFDWHVISKIHQQVYGDAINK